MQPVLQDGGVQATEVQIGSQVALRQVFRLPGRILAILPTLHRVTDHEGHTTSAVICARAIIAHTPTELGEQEHEDIIGGIVFPEVSEEGFNGSGHVSPQGGMDTHLIGVCVKAEVVAVEHAAARSAKCTCAMPLSFLAMEVLGYCTVEEYFCGATFRMSAPSMASSPVCPKYFMTSSVPITGE